MPAAPFAKSVKYSQGLASANWPTNRDLQEQINLYFLLIQLGAKLIALFMRIATLSVNKRVVPAIHHEIVWTRGKAHPMSQGILTVHPAVISAIEDSSMVRDYDAQGHKQ